MKKRNLAPIHPGEILREDFMKPFHLSQYGLAKALHVTPTRISEIIHGKRAITADIAIRLARFFRMEAKFWMNLQSSYDLEVNMILSEREHYPEIKPIGHNVTKFNPPHLMGPTTT